MPPPAASHFDKFVRAIHRRMVLLRTAERAGLCAGVAGGAALVTEAVLLWWGKPAMPIALLSLGGGCAVGLAWGILRRPTPIVAAMEADRQLRWNDLLSTAWSIRNSMSYKPDAPQAVLGPWDTTILAMADAKCRQARPSSLLLHRWGGRAWSAVGLVGVLAVTLGLIPARHATADAAPLAPQFAGQSWAQTNPEGKPSPVAAPSGSPGARPTASPADEPGRSAPQTPPDGSANVPPDPDKATPSANAPDNASDPANASAVRQTAVHPPATPAVASPGNPGAAAGASAGSGDQIVPGPQVSAGPAGGPADLTPAAPPTPPWAATDWPTARSAALSAVHAGIVPGQYHDLVRDYFERR